MLFVKNDWLTALGTTFLVQINILFQRLGKTCHMVNIVRIEDSCKSLVSMKDRGRSFPDDLGDARGPET